MAKALVLTLLSITALFVAGCSGSTTTTVTVTQTQTQATTTMGSMGTTQGTSSAEPSGGHTVTMTDNSFTPNALTVKAFTNVLFPNHGTVDHTVTISPQGSPAGTTVLDRPVQPNSSADYTFQNRGTYDVWCKYHGAQGSGMHMTVTVT